MMNTVLLDKDKHDRNRFNCGTEALNNYLKVMASQQAKKDYTRPFVLEDYNNSAYILGFFPLTKPPHYLQGSTNPQPLEGSLLV